MSRKSESQMKKDKIWIFAGTTEGRLLTRYASQMKMKCCVSTATEYGKSVLGENEGIRVIPGRMDQSKMRAFIRENNIGLAVDATHPFARQVTENICAACEEEKIKYVRCLRERETNDPADHAGETKTHICGFGRRSGGIFKKDRRECADIYREQRTAFVYPDKRL